MPLSKPDRRMLQHRRTVECCGYKRDDGLFDIEARLLDIKTETVHLPLRGDIPASEPIHDLGLRVTLDEQLLIHRVEAFIDDSPFPVCSGVAQAFTKLEGTRISAGWQRQCKELVGGYRGCTHLNELLQPIATTAVQTLWPNRDVDVMQQGAAVRMINSCQSWAQDSEVIKQLLPEHYKPVSPDVEREGI